jgi:hypothetical protein
MSLQYHWRSGFFNRTMKILRLLILAIAIPTFGQGTIRFSTRVPGSIDAPISYGQRGAGSIPGAMAQLFLIPESGGVPIPLAPATTFRTDSPNAMFYVNEPNESVVVPGAVAGSTVAILVRAWVGSSWETSSMYGESISIQVTLGGLTAEGTLIPDAVLEGLEGFELIVPEPSTIALGVLGAAALLYRRRK